MAHASGCGWNESRGRFGGKTRGGKRPATKRRAWTNPSQATLGWEGGISGWKGDRIEDRKSTWGPHGSEDPAGGALEATQNGKDANGNRQKKRVFNNHGGRPTGKKMKRKQRVWVVGVKTKGEKAHCGCLLSGSANRARHSPKSGGGRRGLKRRWQRERIRYNRAFLLETRVGRSTTGPRGMVLGERGVRHRWDGKGNTQHHVRKRPRNCPIGV